MRRLIVFLLPFLIFFSLASSARGHLQVFTEHIAEFKSEIDIQKDGSVNVSETIVYDFANLEKHGIIRKIPFIKTNKEGKRFRMNMNVISVNDEKGNNYNYKTTNLDDRELELKIGDADKTITGVHTYVITYTVSGALTYFSDHDELYWNVTGNEWTVPIELA